MEWTEQLVAKQKQVTQQILKETEKIKAISDAEREKDVKAIQIKQKIEVLQTKNKISKAQGSSLRFQIWSLLGEFNDPTA